MRVPARIFDALTLFVLFLAIGYGYLTGTSRSGIEWVGLTCLVLSFGLTVMLAAYFRFVDRRINTLPEDVEQAAVSDGAGELGFFSPGSFWPFLLASSIMITGYGAAFLSWWLIATGAVLIIVTACGLVFEYYWGQETH